MATSSQWIAKKWNNKVTYMDSGKLSRRGGSGRGEIFRHYYRLNMLKYFHRNLLFWNLREACWRRLHDHTSVK